MWRQLIDHDEAWPESSSSAMFTFALITGVKNGWLDAKTYGPAARNAWIAVAGYIDQNQNITSVCEGTGKKNNYDYYMQKKAHNRRLPRTSSRPMGRLRPASLTWRMSPFPAEPKRPAKPYRSLDNIC